MSRDCPSSSGIAGRVWILVIGCLVSVLADAAETAVPLWRADFTTMSTLAEGGWRRVGDEGASDWQLRDGCLDMNFRQKPYQGGAIERDLPFVPDADLRLEVATGMTVNGGHDNFSLCFAFQGMLLAFKNYGGHVLQRYWEGKWMAIGVGIPYGKRIAVRVVFTPSENGLVEYFVDDMISPVLVEDGIYLKAPPPGKPTPPFTISNYGLSAGVIRHQAYRIEVGRAPVVAPAAGRRPVQSERARVFQGMTFQRYRAPELARSLGATTVDTCTLHNTAVALGVENRFRLDRLPPVAEPSVPAYQILADMPLNVENLKTLSVRALARSVADGSHLVVLGGMFTLNKGYMAGTVLEELLPVEVKDPWAVLRTAGQEILPGGLMAYRHVLPVRPAAQVLETIDGKPLWVTWRQGAGRVTVFLGMPYGDFGDRAFWSRPGWINYATTMIRAGASRD